MATKKNNDRSQSVEVKETTTVSATAAPQHEVKEPVREDLYKATESAVASTPVAAQKTSYNELVIIKDTPLRKSPTMRNDDICGTARRGNSFPIINIVSNMTGTYYFVNGKRYIKDCPDVEKI